MCFGCGGRNAGGLHLTFTLDARRRRIATRWTPAKRHQGYADIVHGGMLTLVLDELMGNLLWRIQRPAVTAELTTRFLRPAPVGRPLRCEASIKSESGRLLWLQAVAKTVAGQVVATAAARFVRVE